MARARRSQRKLLALFLPLRGSPPHFQSHAHFLTTPVSLLPLSVGSSCIPRYSVAFPSLPHRFLDEPPPPTPVEHTPTPLTPAPAVNRPGCPHAPPSNVRRERSPRRPPPPRTKGLKLSRPIAKRRDTPRDELCSQRVRKSERRRLEKGRYKWRRYPPSGSLTR